MNQRINQPGIRTLSVLTAVAITAIFARATALQLLRQLPVPELPPRIGNWLILPAKPLPLDRERDAPPAHYYVCTAPNRPRVFVSIARATTLNSFRAPFEYLFDPDGRVVGNQKTLVPRTNQKVPLRMWALGIGHDTIALLQHWVQPWMQDPIPEPTDVPWQVLAIAWLHQPAFVCDVWVPIRTGDDINQIDRAVSEIADAIDAQIKAGHTP
ncbi:MAG: hypothetical protein RMJ43_07550 [Chloroherpetonaceae bacterium]|nr:hypothetical protein [Chthonomonadaceae bacterium]MDW8207676.1 hypothetical protein [Chloroherpetonaceae bacterium]